MFIQPMKERMKPTEPVRLSESIGPLELVEIQLEEGPRAIPFF